MVKLVDKFKETDLYVIAAPMWNLSFPSPLKEYIDYIVMDGKTIHIDNEEKINAIQNEMTKIDDVLEEVWR